MPVLALIPVAASLVRVRPEQKGLAGVFQPRLQTLQSSLSVEAVERKARILSHCLIGALSQVI